MAVAICLLNSAAAGPMRLTIFLRSFAFAIAMAFAICPFRRPPPVGVLLAVRFFSRPNLIVVLLAVRPCFFRFRHSAILNTCRGNPYLIFRKIRRPSPRAAGGSSRVAVAISAGKTVVRTNCPTVGRVVASRFRRRGKTTGRRDPFLPRSDTDSATTPTRDPSRGLRYKSLSGVRRRRGS